MFVFHKREHVHRSPVSFHKRELTPGLSHAHTDQAAQETAMGGDSARRIMFRGKTPPTKAWTTEKLR